MQLKPFTIVIIVMSGLAGTCVSLLSQQFPSGTAWNILLLNIGSGLIATAFISIILDIFWARERARVERDELQPFLDKFQGFANQLTKLEGRLEAFKQLGLNYCHASRQNALQSFLNHAREMIGDIPPAKAQDLGCVECRGTINIVSSSARGLMGYLDREAHEVQKAWRMLIVTHPKNFRILLTHPAFAHLRQPAEERSSGDIELEILKTAVYLHCVADMRQQQLRFYRGSPTVFLIQTKKHILLNPYPYGKMAMDTLCLEFESENEGSYVAGFVSMHFNHTWEFIHQDSKRVDNYPLVEGVNSFEDILRAFGECVFLNNAKRLRLTRHQVEELDTFACKTIEEKHGALQNNPPSPNPFWGYVEAHGLTCAEDGDAGTHSGEQKRVQQGDAPDASGAAGDR